VRVPGADLALAVRAGQHRLGDVTAAEGWPDSRTRPDHRLWVNDQGEEVAMAREVDRERVRGLMEQGAQIIDVLPAQDYGEDHLPGAINLPLRRIEAEAISALDPTRAIVVYCADTA